MIANIIGCVLDVLLFCIGIIVAQRESFRVYGVIIGVLGALIVMYNGLNLVFM
jgi:hypothetical protein